MIFKFFKVAFFAPILPSSAQIRSYKSMYGLTATPEIDAGFYFDLAVRSLTAVHNMKSGGSWPEMTYTKCSEYTSDVPIDRSIDLISSIKVCRISLYFPDLYKISAVSIHAGCLWLYDAGFQWSELHEF